MKKSFSFIAVLFLSLYLASCDPAETTFGNLKQFVENTEEEYLEYSDEEWNRAIKEFERIEEEIEKHNYSKEELKEIGRLKGRLYAIIAKQSIREFSNTLENIGHELQGGIEGFLETINK